MIPPTFFPERRKRNVPDVDSSLELAMPLVDRRTSRQRLTVSRRVSQLVVLMCLLLSGILYNYAVKFEEMHARFEFGKLTNTSVGSIENRISSYAQMLTGTAAHLALTGEDGLATLEEYVNGLDLVKSYPGALGVGFVRAVPARDVPALERALSAQYGRAVEVRSGSAQTEKMILTHVAPSAGNAAAIGIDNSVDSVRRAALLDARAGGGTALSARLILVQDETRQAGFLMARGVFAGPWISEAPRDVKNRFMGWVVVPFIGSSVLADVTTNVGQDYEFSVFEGTVPDPAAVLFSSVEGPDQNGAFTTDHVIGLHGRSWLVRFASTPAFDAAYSSQLPNALLALGMLLTLFVALALKSTAQNSSALVNVANMRMKQLGAREAENRALLETNISVVVMLDGQGRITFANEAASVLFGCGRDAFEGRRFSDFVRPHGTKRADGMSNADGFLPSGEKLLLDVQTNTWRTAEDVTQTTVLIRDVTEQINARKMIEALHKRYDIALTGAGIGIFEIDIATGDAQMSETWHKIMGTDNLGVAFDHQRHFLSRVHPDDLPDLITADRRCIAGETPRSFAEYRVRFEDGWRWMYSNAVPVAAGRDGHKTRLIGTQSDITQLRHARNALELSEARFRMVLEDAPVGMAVISEGGTFIGVNAALARLSGYDTAEMRNKMRLADMLSRKEFVEMSRDMRSLLKSGSAKTYQNQFRLRTRSGEERWGLFNLSWTYDKNRAENVYIAQIVDITDQKRVEQIKSEFVATVSHELRTPLTSIKGALGLLGATAAQVLPEGAMRLLDIARINTDRLTVLVNDILDLERISSGEVAFENERIAVHKIVSQTLVDLTPLASEHGNTLVLEPVDDWLIVEVDAGRFRQVIGNLVSNACKFSDPDTPVIVRYAQRGDDAAIYVENTGPRVPDRFEAQIFDAFTQVDSSDTKSKGGTGLGLNIARQIVMRFGGQIGFEQISDNKTMFWFTCPLAEGVTEDEVLDAAQDAAAPKALLQVLHLEGDREFAEALTRAFVGKAEVSRVRNAQQVRRMIHARTWDAVLLDLNLVQSEVGPLIDLIQEHHPDASILGLGDKAGSTSDARMCACVIKSLEEVSDIVERVVAVCQTPVRGPAAPVIDIAALRKTAR